MGNDGNEVVQAQKNSFSAKVHVSMSLELTKMVDSVVTILPAIESARPGCSSGMQELCCLHNLIEKAKLLLQHCAESSKLYLAITGEATLLRCERIRNDLNQSFCRIQNMVPTLLTSQISEVLDYLRHANFVIDSAEEEAGRALLELLKKTKASEDLELEAFQIASSRLNITSPKAILIEKRAIRKLRDKIRDTESKKERWLDYLLYLLEKHGKNMRPDNIEHKENANEQSKPLTPGTSSACGSGNSERNDEFGDHGEAQTDLSRTASPPEEFCCPISSRLMFDPVVIASGQTYERIWIEKWFDEGHDTCPKTQKKLSNLSIIPNSCMRDLISNWCSKHGISIVDPCSQPTPATFRSWEPSHCNSMSSLENISAPLLDGKTGEYIVKRVHSNVSFISYDASCSSDSSPDRGIENPKGNYAQLFPWSDDYQKYQSFSNFNHDMFLRFFYGLSKLSLDLQGRAVEDAKILLAGDEQTCYAMLSNGFAESLLQFLKNAHDLSDVQAQKTGAQFFLAFLSNSRVEIPSLGEKVFQLLTSFLDSEITTEALMILQKLSHFPNCRSGIVTSGITSSVIKFLNSEDTEFLELSMKILCDLSLQNEIKCLILSSGCISQLLSLLSDGRLAEFCFKIMQNLSGDEDAAASIANTDGCLAAIVELLNTGTREEQQYAATILHSLCSHGSANCLLVLKEGVIPALVDISVNGNANGKASSLKLLLLLREITRKEHLDSSYAQSGTMSEAPEDSIECSASKKQRSKSSVFFGKKIKLLSKLRSLAALF
ncbi:U-box domain-containing protein 5 [Elaeis guineensis]|uniref:RING-type E3 ubiquitin transferase n=1 Tax=Elaeis guineensis var. tenera TaxID=51953 RepID=A0A6I9S2I9_ELAGV|nr:U-box domain-containing protein 5 [Elaeis guineensis]